MTGVCHDIDAFFYLLGKKLKNTGPEKDQYYGQYPEYHRKEKVFLH